MSQVDEAPSKKIVVSQELLNIFWVLAEGNEQDRISATNKLIGHLCEKQGKESTLCKEVEYTLTRLVRGLASKRKWARLGFSLALSQVLRNITVIQPDTIFGRLQQELKITKKETPAELSNLLLGRIMLCLSVIQSDKLQQSGKKILDVVHILHSSQKQKEPLQQICTQGLAGVVTKLSSEDFEKYAWPSLNSKLSVGWGEDCTPSTLLLLLVAKKYQQDFVDKKFIQAHWNDKHIVTEKNFDAISDVIMKSTSDHPVIHPVCYALLNEAARKPSLLQKFWQQVFDGKVLQGAVPRKYLCLQLVPYALSLATNTEQINTIISPVLLQCVMKGLQNKDQILHAASEQLVEAWVKYVSKCSDGEMQVAMVTRLLTPPGSIRFDSITKTKTISSMTHLFTQEAVELWVKFLQSVILGHKSLGSQDKDLQRKWVISSLCNVITVTTDAALRLNILQFLCLHSFFTIKSPTADIAHLEMEAKEELDDNIRKALEDAFFKALCNLATFRSEKGPKDHRGYINMVYEVVHYAETLLTETQYVTIIKNFKAETKEEWEKMIKITEKIHTKHIKDTKIGDGQAFELLFVQLGLQLLTDPQGASDALQELHTCYEKAFAKKRRVSMMKKEEDGEPAWVEVVTEMLLSLLSQQSYLFRVVASTVMGMLAPHLTRGALNLILTVLKPGSQEEDPINFEDEEMSEEIENEKDSEESDDQEEEDEEEDSSSEEESEDEDALQVDEDLKAKVKAALGDAAKDVGESDKSDDEDSEPDLDDDAMFRLDDAVAAAFKSMKKGRTKEDKENALQLKHYKLRCLDLVMSMVTNDAPLTIQLDLLLPLMDIIDEGRRNKELQDEGKKATNIFTKLTANKKISNTIDATPDIDKSSLSQRIQDIISYSTKAVSTPLAKNIGIAVVFVMRMMMGLEDLSGPSPVKTRAKAAQKVDLVKNKVPKIDHLQSVIDVLKKSLDDFCTKRDTHLNHLLFHTILERQAVLMWPLTEHLLKLTLDDSIRVFCRTRVCAMLTAMLTKPTVQEVNQDMQAFRQQLTSSLCSQVTKESSSNFKPGYVHELLLLLNRTLSVFDDKIKEYIPPDFGDAVMKLQARVNKDTKKTVKTLLQKLGYKNDQIHQEKQGKRKNNQKSNNSIPAKRRKSNEGQNGGAENQDEESGSNSVGDVEQNKDHKLSRKERKSAKKRKTSEENLVEKEEISTQGHTEENTSENGNSQTPKKSKKSKKKLNESGSESVSPSDQTLQNSQQNPNKSSKKKKKEKEHKTK